MFDRKQFINAKIISGDNGKNTKAPCLPDGKIVNAHDSGNWLTYEEAKGYAEQNKMLVAFVFTENDPYFFVDIDHCLMPDGKSWSPLAIEICRIFAGAFVEVSISGTGLHIFGSYTHCPPHSCKNIGLGLELYHEKRFAVLGTRQQGDPNIDRTTPLEEFITQYMSFSPVRDDVSKQGWTRDPVPEWYGPEDDKDLIEKACKFLSPASTFGHKASFEALWKEDIQALTNVFPDLTGKRSYDASSADMALACHLAFWTGKNCERIKKLMQQSGLKRDKWKRPDYLIRTITKACGQQQNVYKNDAPSIQKHPVKEAPQKGFIFLPVSQVINSWAPAQWLINGYIEKHTMALIFGDPASGKSFIAIDKACCIATGTPFYGHDVCRGAVFYIAGEGFNGLASRFKAWERQNGVSLENTPLYVSNSPAQLYDKGHADNVAEAVQELADTTEEKPALIVIDTLARNFGGGDENSTQDMNLFIHHVDEMKNRWKATVLIVHHTGHSDKKRARGAMALKGALDHEYMVQKDSSGIISLHNTKTKDGPEPDPLYFQITTVPILLNSDNFPVEGAVLENINGFTAQKKLSPQRQKAVDILQKILTDKGQKRHVRKGMAQVNCVSLDEYRKALNLQNIVASDDPDNIRRSISRIITQLNNDGLTVGYGDYVWLPDKPDKTGRTNNGKIPAPDGQDKTL